MSDIEDIASRTASEIALAFRTGEADPVELTECYLDRIEQSRDDNIFTSVTADRARREAEAARARHRSGRPLSALDGVPIAWKDLLDVAGSPTTAGSRVAAERKVRTTDSRVVANAAAAGMVSLGKLNMTELAYSGLGHNPHYGTPVNPNDRRVHRSPGGSSSGSGAVVAAGLAPCAIGTDTGGSIRVPASFNGVVGFKTSEGRIEKADMVPLSRTLDTIGPLGRSVADCALVDMVLRGAPAVDAVRTDLRTLTLLAPTNLVLDGADAAVVANFERSLDALARAGARIERRRIKALDDAEDVKGRHGTLTAAESYHEYRDLVESPAVREIDRRVVHRIMQGKAMSAYDLMVVQTSRRRFIAELDAEMGNALLVMPTTPVTAPEVAPLDADDDLFHKTNLLTLRNTYLGNLLSLCGLALPNGRDGKDLPTSILISGRHGDDVRLLGYGLEIERVLADSFEPTWKRAWTHGVGQAQAAQGRSHTTERIMQ